MTESPAPSPAVRFAQTPWPRLAGLAGLILALLLLYWSSFASIVAVWIRSDTFTHGFLVVPIAGYLIWRARATLAAIPCEPDWRALPPLWAFGLMWLLGRVTEVALIEQLSVVAMAVVLVWLVLGWSTLRALAFPLGFLFFAVPMGEELVYPMMRLTAAIAVGLLKLSGIPVYSDGTFFSIPSGDWSVVEACSGVRYLIASIFLGVLYAYFSYRAPWRRLLFILLSALLPIVANGMRAYLIVLIGHFSNMRLAVGIDHLIYGWVFFGIVMFLMFALGRLWAEPETADTASSDAAPASIQARAASLPRASALLLIGLVSMLIWPLWAEHVAARTARAPQPQWSQLAGQGGWQSTATPLTAWTPNYQGAARMARQHFSAGQDRIELILAIYGPGNPELVSWTNAIVRQKDPLWRMPTQTRILVRIDERQRSVIEARVQSSAERLLVWRWYWVNGRLVAEDIWAKIHAALAVLRGQPRQEAAIFIATRIQELEAPARERLRVFAEQMIGPIAQGLEAAFRETEPATSTAP